MAKLIIRELTVTRVKYNTIEVVEGVPTFVEHPDAVFRGSLDEQRVKRMLVKMLGKEVQFVVVGIDAGKHRFGVSLEDFVRNAVIVDEDAVSDEVEDESESEDGSELVEEVEDGDGDTSSEM